MQSTVTKKSYTLIDILKLFLALLILFSHFFNEHAKGKLPKGLDLAVSIYILAVPMYFAFSGYFLFKKIYNSDPSGHKAFLKNYCFKIMRLYGVWSAIYIFLRIITWIRFKPTSDAVLDYIHRSLVYSTYNTIWFLPATAVGAVIAVLLRKRFGDKGMFCFAALFCLIGAMGDCYSSITEDIPVAGQLLSAYKNVFITTRNGVFNGFPYIAVGAMAAYMQGHDKTEYHPVFNRYFCGAVFFGGAFIAEAIVSKKIADANNSNTIIMLFPFTIFAVYWCVISAQPGISKGASEYMRKMSTAIFLAQRLFLSALPELMPATVFTVMLDDKGWKIGLCWVTGCTVLFSAVLIALSGKFTCLKKLYQ